MSTTKNDTKELPYKAIFDSMIDGFALHEIICDETGKPIDYRFLKLNKTFEEMTGLKAAELIGNNVLTVLPNTEKYWIETYGQVALTGKPAHFENYSKELDKYYKVSAFCPYKNQFAVLIIDITETKLATQKIKATLEETSKMLDLTNNREIKMIELKEEISRLKKRISELENDNSN